ncbi:hypothetical protein HK107_15245 [Parvularcula sp. ZS-1/3]|uniref:SRPBCC domain-containing protein n=1 Tax=Parvularcula mediterranea TaxID=2732508 RepID=A0A7Y3RP44_9PROT|nr:hypothetical protein [Parvularcula mediterranea]NNU17686.1 hypothetical protein [Parvularcula mediterranea]
MQRSILTSTLALTALGIASAEVVTASDTGFKLKHEAVSPLAPDALWERLMEPSEWWDGAHSYSGDAANLSMEDSAGSYWREDWEGGSVIHGQILTVMKGKQLVLSAPFGPLHATGAECIWTIILAPAEGGGTKISSTHTVAGSEGTGLQELAGPVDFVMGNGIMRLAEAP